MYNFYKAGLAVPKIKITDSEYNSKEIYKLIIRAEELGMQIIVFPELCLTGATCLDLFKQIDLIDNARKNFDWLVKNLEKTKILCVIGLPLKFNRNLFNCAVVFQSGKVLGIIPKKNLSDTDRRCFVNTKEIFNKTKENFLVLDNIPFGDLIFEIDDKFLLKINFDTDFSPNVDLNLNLSAKPIQINNDFDELIIKSECIKNKSACVFANSGFGESTTDFVYNSSGFIYECEKKLAQTEKYFSQSQIIYNDIDFDALTPKYRLNFEPDSLIRIKLPGQNKITRKFSRNPFFDSSAQTSLNKTKVLEEILLIQRNAIITRFEKSHAEKIIVGVSGGVDSTLTLLNAVFVCDHLNLSRKNIFGITMPGFGTSNKTLSNSEILLKHLDITSKKISIRESCEKHFEDIGHDLKITDTTFENAQARERTQILFDLANKFNGIVLGTGDMSEEALGFATYNGDHISNYNPNANLTKTIVRELIYFISNKKYFSDTINSCLKNIFETPVSPELLPLNNDGEIIQQTENIVGPYELIDFFIYYVLRHGYSKQKILFLAQKVFQEYSSDQIEKYFHEFYKRFISQQFKRSCSNDAPQIFDFGFSPRNSFLMPSDV